MPHSDRQPGDQARKLLGHLMWNINSERLQPRVQPLRLGGQLQRYICTHEHEHVCGHPSSKPGGRHAEIRAQQLNNPRRQHVASYSVHLTKSRTVIPTHSASVIQQASGQLVLCLSITSIVGNLT